MADLSVKIAGVEFPNPVIAASGTYGNGECFTDLYPLSRLGGISCKGMTIVPKMGNVPPRIAETPSGILNSVGLQNIGVHGFIEYYLPTLKEEGNVIIANVAGATIDDYIAAAEALDVTNVDMIELNISCPNVKAGGATWGVTCEGAASVTKAVRAATSKPLIVKLTPNVTNITEIAKAVEADKHAPRNAHRYPHKAPDTPQQCRRTFRPGYIPGGSAHGMAVLQRGEDPDNRHGRHLHLGGRSRDDDGRRVRDTDGHGDIHRPVVADKGHRGSERLHGQERHKGSFRDSRPGQTMGLILNSEFGMRNSELMCPLRGRFQISGN